MKLLFSPKWRGDAMQAETLSNDGFSYTRHSCVPAHAVGPSMDPMRAGRFQELVAQAGNLPTRAAPDSVIRFSTSGLTKSRVWPTLWYSEIHDKANLDEGCSASAQRGEESLHRGTLPIRKRHPPRNTTRPWKEAYSGVLG